MPELDTKLHLIMLQKSRKKGQTEGGKIYGVQWGDPEARAELAHIKDNWLLPYVKPDQVGLEIGPGGGRWTQYMLAFKRLWAVDFHQELLDELRRNFAQENITMLKNNGTDFPGVPEHSVDFIFSFGVFVHLAIDVQKSYLRNFHGIIKPTTNIVIQYADFDKKPARQNDTFTENNPRIMRAMVEEAGFEIIEEDNKTLWHSAIMRFRARQA